MCLDKAVYWSRILLLGLAVGEQMPRLGTAALPCGWAMSGAGGIEYESQWNWGGSSCSQDVQVTRRLPRDPPREPCLQGPTEATCLLLQPPTVGGLMVGLLTLFHNKYEFKDSMKHPEYVS